VLKLIRAFLNAGVMENGLVRPVDEGTPQGGPLSPLLSNLLLDDLDKELERRGLRFASMLTMRTFTSAVVVPVNASWPR
jgi:RNA-directed DNA polymerase